MDADHTGNDCSRWIILDKDGRIWLLLSQKGAASDIHVDGGGAGTWLFQGHVLSCNKTSYRETSLHAETCMINGVYMLLGRPNTGVYHQIEAWTGIFLYCSTRKTPKPQATSSQRATTSALTVQRLMMLVHVECVKQCVIRVAAMTYGCNTRLLPKQRASELYFVEICPHVITANRPKNTKAQIKDLDVDSSVKRVEHACRL